jgi:hypothetical protein
MPYIGGTNHSGKRADQLQSRAEGGFMANLERPRVRDPQLESLTLPELRAFLAKSTWTYAKTMPKTPHEYTLRKNAPDEALFKRVVMHIRLHGYRRVYGRAIYAYLDIDGWQYWTMGSQLSETILINRARLSMEY